MEPKIFLWDGFSNEGRLKKLWARALNETDPEVSSDLLRTVREKLHEVPAEFAHLWLPFLDTLFTQQHVRQLSHADLRAIEAMGQTLLTVTNPPSSPMPSDIWLRLVKAYDMRGETALAQSLLARIYRNPAVSEIIKSQCIRALVQRGTTSDEYLQLYLEYLSNPRDQQTEEALFPLLEQLCAIDFSATPAQLERSQRILRVLTSRHFRLVKPHFAIAQGLSTLLIEQAPDKALNHFANAYQADQTNQVALIGCIVCWMQLGYCDQVIIRLQDPQQRPHQQNPIIASLLDICKIIQWLNYPRTPEPLPYDLDKIDRLAYMDLHLYAGNIVHVTLGQLYLLVGATQKALNAFSLLTPSPTNRPQWTYYSSWASILAGKLQPIAQFFTTLADWPGRWTIACLLLDADAGLAEECGALALLQKLSRSQEPQAAILAQKLSGRGTAATENADQEAGSFLEGELEILRVRLARAASTRETFVLERLTWQPLFLRLPLAEQLFWKGLLNLLHQNRSQGIAQLEKAAWSFRHRRAALFLGLYAVKQGNMPLAAPYLDLALEGSTEPRSQLIRTYKESQASSLDVAIGQFEQLATTLDLEAHYILGTLYIYKATYEPDKARQYQQHAAQAWNQALENAEEAIPRDLKILERCATFRAYPQRRARTASGFWQTWQKLEEELRQSWIAWHVTLATLWYGTPHEIAGAIEDCRRIVNLAGKLSPAAAAELVKTLALAASKVESQTQVNNLLSLLDQLYRQSTLLPVKYLCQIGISVTLYARYQRVEADQQERIEQDLHQRIQQQPEAEYFTFLLITFYLKRGRLSEAKALLQIAAARHRRFASLSRNLLELLIGRIPAAGNPPPPDDSDSVKSSTLQDILSMLRSFAGNNARQGYETLARQQTARVFLCWKQEHLLPAFCTYLLKNERPVPIFLADLALEQIRASSAEQTNIRSGEQTITLARREHTPSDISTRGQNKTRQDELARILCRYALRLQKAGKSFEAAGTLKLVALLISETADSNLNGPELLARARSLELRAASARLLTFLFPELVDQQTHPERYHCLALAIARSPVLLRALVHEEREQIQAEWNNVLQAHADEARFLHMLGVFYREVMLYKREQQIAEARDWVTSTALWTLMLSSEAFWHYFAHERTDGKQNSQSALEKHQQQELWQDTLEHLLAPHRAVIEENVTSANVPIHLRCLALCWQGEKQLLAAIEANGLFFSLPIAAPWMARIRLLAQKFLQEWSQALLSEAKKILDDARAIEQLPSGLHKNYENALNILLPLIDLDVPFKRLLLTCLEWYNDWWYELHLTSPQPAELRAIADAAHRVAIGLKPLSTRANASSPENKALALHLASYGYSLEHLETAIQMYEEALAWNPNTLNAEEWLEKARVQLLQQRVLAHADKGRFDTAYRLVEQGKATVKATSLQGLHAQLYLRQGQRLALEGSYSEALERGKQSLYLDPHDPVIQQFVQEMEEMRPQEEYSRLLKEAENVLEQRNFEQALLILTRIPRTSRLFKQALNLRVSIHIQNAVDFTDKNQWDNAEEQLRLAGKIDEMGDKRLLIQQQLSTVLTRKAAEELKRTRDLNINTQKGQIKSRNIYARSLLEEAIELRHENLDARRYLEDLNAL